MLEMLRHLQSAWLNWDKLYLARPENLPLLLVGLPLLSFFFIAIWIFRIRKRIERTHGSKYSRLMDMKMWLGMMVVYGLTALASAKPMIAKSSLETRLGPVEVMFLVDLSLSAHLKHFGESGPTVLDMAKAQIRDIEPTLTAADQAAVFYFAKNAYEAHPIFPLDESIRPLFNKAIEDIQLPKKLNDVTTYNPTLHFVDSTNIVSILRETYRKYDQTQKLRDPDYKVSFQNNRLIFMMSDGDFHLDEASGKSAAEDVELATYKKELSECLGELRKRGMIIYSIGIGSQNGVPLANALKKYKKDLDFDQAFEDAIVERGRTRVNIPALRMLAKETGGNPSSDVFLVDGLGASPYDFMNRAINSHRQPNQARTIESRNDEPLWKSIVLVAIGLTALSLVGWKIFTVCLIAFYFFGGLIISHVPISSLWDWVISGVARVLA